MKWAVVFSLLLASLFGYVGSARAIRLKYLMTACLLALTFGSANANTFVWSLSGDPGFGITGSGMLTATAGGGQFLVDSISGSVSVTCTGTPCAPQFRTITGLLTPHQSYASISDIGGDNIIFPVSTPTILDNDGIVFSIGECPFASGCYLRIFYDTQYELLTSNAGVNGIEFNLTADTAATPLPAALPLFASGLGALVLFGWRKKRKRAPIV
jgi:hypothetical protein